MSNRILYVFPHPDDESFGPGHAIAKQRREGDEVYLLTLTKGGATRQRHRYGYSVEQMGEVRYEEMQRVSEVLQLSGLTVLDLPDGGLKEVDPREVERVVAAEIRRRQPQVVVTYPVHGISGFHDHLVCHAAVKRVFVELKETEPYLKRLAFLAVKEEEALRSPKFRLSASTPEEIDCIVEVEAVDLEAARRALDCYVSYQETIAQTGIKELIMERVAFEIFQDDHTPPLSDLFEKLP